MRPITQRLGPFGFLSDRRQVPSKPIEDDGVGFDPSSSRSDLHFGLQLMSERAAEIGAELEIRSSLG